MNKSITFEASIPSIQRAIQISGSGGVRVELDIPESSMPAALHLVTLREQPLTVTVEGNGPDIQAPKVSKREGERFSPSQRMRNAIWSEWSVDQSGTFEDWYRTRMDRLIEGIENGSI